MPTRELLSPAQRVQFMTLPALSARDLARHYTLSADDLAAITRRRRPHNRLGFAVQLAYLRFPGRPLQPDEPAPPAVVAKLAGQVGVDPAALDEYARERDATRREHLLELAADVRLPPLRRPRVPGARGLAAAHRVGHGRRRGARRRPPRRAARAPDRRPGPVHRRAAGLGDPPPGPAPGVRPPDRRPDRAPSARPWTPCSSPRRGAGGAPGPAR